MAKHLNPLEKEFLIRQYKSNQKIKLSDFCTANHISDSAFKNWLKQYDEGAAHLLQLKKLIKQANEENCARLKEPTLLIAITGGEMAYTRDDGVKIIPIGTLKD